MPSPAEQPPSLSEFPTALRKSLKLVLDYIKRTHIDGATIEPNPSVNSEVKFKRGQSGTFMQIVLGADAGGAGSLTVTTEDASGYAPGAGVPSVANVNVLTFDQDNFEIYDGGGGQCVVKLKSCAATCGAS